MKIKLDTPIVSANGKPMKGAEGKDLTVRECLTVLLTYYKAPMKARFIQVSAGLKVGNEEVNEVELTTKETETLRLAVEANEVETDRGSKSIYGTWILGQLPDLGEGEE